MGHRFSYEFLPNNNKTNVCELQIFKKTRNINYYNQKDKVNLETIYFFNLTKTIIFDLYTHTHKTK